jgi:hypothetical protein
MLSDGADLVLFGTVVFCITSLCVSNLSDLAIVSCFPSSSHKKLI